MAALLWLLGTAGLAWGRCPDWIKKDLPVCPAGGSKMLPDNYPALAHMVSDQNYAGSRPTTGRKFAADFVEEVLKASGDKVPLLFLSVSDASYRYIKDRITTLAGDDAEKKKKWLAALKQVKGASWTWQQDFFEATVDMSTGKAKLRRVDDYGGDRAAFVKDAAKKLFDTATDACDQIEKGPDLKPAGDTESPHSGGNIEGLPGGLCLHGNNIEPSYARQFCDRGSEVVIDSNWLGVGHVDEIVATVKNPKAKAPCDFAITVASPDKGLELLKKSPKERFFTFFAERLPADVLDSRERASPVKEICEAVRRYKDGLSKATPSDDGLPRRKEEDSHASIWDLLFPPAYAAVARACRGITNGDVATAIEMTPDLYRLNKLVQASMDETKKTIAAKIKARLPACDVTFIDVPNLFHGPPPDKIRPMKGTKITDRYKLVARSVGSILPNPTNGVMVEKTYVSSKPHNKAFNDYLDNEYGKLGLSHTTVDTWDHAHRGDGNLHCSTHTVRICKGRDTK